MSDNISDNIVHLAAKRPPVVYGLTVTHHHDDTVEVTVHDVQDDPRSRDEVRRTMVRLAAIWMGPEDWHGLTLAMVDRLMEMAPRSAEQLAALVAIAAACKSYERIVFP